MRSKSLMIFCYVMSVWCFGSFIINVLTAQPVWAAISLVSLVVNLWVAQIEREGQER